MNFIGTLLVSPWAISLSSFVSSSFIRASEHDSQDLIHDSPLFAYLAPGRFAAIDRSNAFPFPAEMKK